MSLTARTTEYAQALSALDAAAVAHRAAADGVEKAVFIARMHNVTWRDIGRALGMTGQGAAQRFEHRVDGR